jgi:hypothetical protein
MTTTTNTICDCFQRSDLSPHLYHAMNCDRLNYPEYEFKVPEGNGGVYHWEILRDSQEFSHSAFHLNRNECVLEAEQTVRDYLSFDRTGW